MSEHASNSSRRRFIRLAVTGLAATPLAGALVSQTAQAAPVPVQESDPMATALGYKVDATKATARKDATASCANCNLYSGKAGAADGPCTLFQGNLVSAKGWCTAWAKKP
jgi:hypothetical protein